MPGDELVDLVAVERRDERLVQKLHRLVGDPVGFLLVALDRAAARLELAQVREQRLQLDRGARRELGMGVEQVEEPSFPRQETHGRVVSEVRWEGKRMDEAGKCVVIIAFRTRQRPRRYAHSM